MTLEIGRRLLSSGAVTGAQIQAALFRHVTQDVPFLRALAEAGVDVQVISLEATRSSAPRLRNVVPALAVIKRLPTDMCHQLLAVPVRVDPITATVDVAAADPFDVHIQREFSFHLEAPVRVVQASLSAIEAALVQVSQELKPPRRQRTRTPVFGSPAARIALQVPTSSSDIPIPLVRRSKPPSAPNSEDHDDADDPGRITRDAIVLDPGSLPAARPSLADLSSSAADGIDVESLEIVIPKSAAVPDIDQAPETSPMLTEAVVGLETALDDLTNASSRDEVVLAALRGMAAVARRVGVFAVRRDAFTGWACTHSFANEADFRAVRIDRRDDTVFAHAAAEGWYFGPVPRTVAHRQLLALLDDASWAGSGARNDQEVAVVAVRLQGRPAMLILATRLLDTMIATRTAERLARASAKALIRVLREEKRQDR